MYVWMDGWMDPSMDRWMDVYGCIWMHMDVYGCIWMYMDVYGLLPRGPNCLGNLLKSQDHTIPE
jgi:hypothetical protein